MTRTTITLALLLSLLALPAALQAGAPNKATEAKLNAVLKTYTLKGPLEQVVKDFAKQTGLRIVVDWAEVTATGVKKNQKVYLSGEKEKARDVLDLLLAAIMLKGKPLGWTAIEGSNIVVSTQARLLSHARSVEAAKAPATAAGKARAARRRATGVRVYNFKNTPLSDVIDFFRTTTNLNFVVNWKALELNGIKKNTPISFNLKNVTPRKALDTTLDLANGSNTDVMTQAHWVVDGGIVLISSGEQLNKVFRTRVFDVTDLLLLVPEFKGPRVKTDEIGSGDSGTSNNSSNNNNTIGNLWDPDEDKNKENKIASTAEQRAAVRDSLVKIVKNSIGEDFWDPIGKGQVQLFQKKMIITQSLLGFKLMEDSARR